MRYLLVLLAALSTGGACHPAPTEREVIARAALLAHGLQDTVGDHRATLRSPAAVQAVFARGFEPDVAAGLTAWVWDSTSQEVKGTEYAVKAPDSLVVLGHWGDSAEVAFVTPLVVRSSPDKPYTVAWLRRRPDGWRVAGAREVAAPPAPLPIPEPMPPEDH